MSRANRGVGRVASARGVKTRACRRLATARATLVQAVFWVRMAPTITSKRVRPGHQP